MRTHPLPYVLHSTRASNNAWQNHAPQYVRNPSAAPGLASCPIDSGSLARLLSGTSRYHKLDD